MAIILVAVALAGCGGPAPPNPQGPAPTTAVNPETGSRGSGAK